MYNRIRIIFSSQYQIIFLCILMNARQIYCNDYQANEFVSRTDTEEEHNNTPSKQLSLTKHIKQDVSQIRDPYDYEIIKKPGQSPTTFVHNNATFGKEYNETVDQNKQLEFIYTYEESENETKALRVSTSSRLAEEKYPIIFVVRQQEGVISWTVPFFLDFKYEFFHVSRTLCPLDQEHRANISKHQKIIIEVSSQVKEPSDFLLQTSIVKNFKLQLGVEKQVTVTPAEPIYYMFTFPDDIESVIVTGLSNDTSCMTISIQDIKCPIYDLDRNIRFHGIFQTMSKESAIVVQKNLYSQNAFYVVLVLMLNNLKCSASDSEKVFPMGSVRTKDLTILVKETISVAHYSRAIIASVGLFLSFYIVAGLALLIYNKCGKKPQFPEISELERERFLWGAAGLIPSDSDSDEKSALPQGYQTQRYGSINERRNDNVSAPLLNPMSPSATTEDTSSVNSSLDTEDIDFLNDAEEEKDVFRTKTALFVSDLSRKGRKKLEKYGKVYNWNLWTIVIFYGLPVIQLVITYQKVLNVTGNEDTCYYNFKCAMPYKVLSSFNNVFSNIGYILLGILFLLLVWRRDLIHREIVKKYGKAEELYGIPQPYGLFYAMGLGLCMEGVMSACYHVCPTYSNFQFDTSFMYIIACLCMLRLYQTRHPDINAKAHTAYLYMAFIIFIAVIGVVYQTPVFWIVFAAIHFVTTLVLSVQIYYMGRWKIDLGLFNRMRLMLCSDFIQCAKPMYKDRLILLIISNIMNWTFAVYGAVKKPSDFASYLLAIFIGNLLFYLFFYLIMKLRSKETIKIWTRFYILMTGILWAFALYFFLNHLTSWQLSPAMSRDKNRACILLGFFDEHDIWHFLSATSMFFSFMILLTLDDDLQLIRRDRIPVF
ncbi:SID1 transmembrane family member 1 isoform X1 [Octopus bimaculoides]|uniref:SID1 transmembrane family member 1 n=1 Tax=Octopus bimaculoides TaxID=37653 RepID=A0A0L8FGV0_OCTBM|nr:SID1 transmembrane family member 1 isoform X1 [Octopus bimaculoides]|eukprot:XP_014789926.1 PREDICTED: SID1 transmembrane family member 1-like isoform X1 [Octopus bimaculoides]